MCKKIFNFLGFFCLILQISGCVAFWRPNAGRVDTSAALKPLAPYNGPKARVIIADFQVQAAKATSEIPVALREMLMATLIGTNRFSIIASDKGQDPKNADLIISASVIEFEPQGSGGRGGIGGGGGVASGAFGGLLGTSLNKARITLDIRIIDMVLSETIAESRLTGQAIDYFNNSNAGLPIVDVPLGKGLSVYAYSPMEKAVRICISETARYIATSIPEKYYKY